MKWIVLSVCLMSIMPLSAYLRRNPHQSPKLWVVVGFLPFVIQYYHWYMAVDSTSAWGGYVKGAEVSILDLIAITLYFSITGPKQPLPFRLSMGLYFLTVLLSAFQAWQPQESLFFPWQLARMFLVYATVTKGCSDPRVTPAVLRGMGAGMIFEAGFAIWQRFAMGLTQTAGTEGHQNLLGVMSHLVILPFFALLLAGRRGPFAVAVSSGRRCCRRVNSIAWHCWIGGLWIRSALCAFSCAKVDLLEAPDLNDGCSCDGGACARRLTRPLKKGLPRFHWVRGWL